MRVPGKGAERREGGLLTVEFAMMMFILIALFAMVGEFLRLSFFDQILGRVAFDAAQAAAQEPGCLSAIRDEIQTHPIGGWLFDQNKDGTVVVDTGGQPEVLVRITADNDITDSIGFSTGLNDCGGQGSWIQVRARVDVLPWFGPARRLWSGGLRRERIGWARNAG